MTAPVVPLLSPGRRRLLTFIRDHQAEHGQAPSLDAAATAVGLPSTAAVAHVLRQLRDTGWITLHPTRPRALVFLNPADGTNS